MTQQPTPILYGPIKQVGQYHVYETYVAGEGRVTHPYKTRELAESSRTYAMIGIGMVSSYRAFTYNDEMGFEAAVEQLRGTHESAHRAAQERARRVTRAYR